MRVTRETLESTTGTASTTSSATGSSRCHHLTPANQSAPNESMTMMTTVPRSLPSSTRPIESPATGPAGIHACQKLSMRFCLRVMIIASHTHSATFTNSEGWSEKPATPIQLRLPPAPKPSGVNTSTCSAMPSMMPSHARRCQMPAGMRAAMSMSTTPTAAKAPCWAKSVKNEPPAT